MLTQIQKNIGISELRGKLSKYFRDAGKAPVIVTMDRGKRTRVVIDVDVYNALVHTWGEQNKQEELQKEFNAWERASDEALVAMEKKQ